MSLYIYVAGCKDSPRDCWATSCTFKRFVFFIVVVVIVAVAVVIVVVMVVVVCINVCVWSCGAFAVLLL